MKLEFQRDVDRLAPQSERYEVYFKDPVGLGVRVTPRSNRYPEGRKVYTLFYRTREGRFRRYTFGGIASDWKLSDVKTEARRLLGQVAQGADPQGEKQEGKERERERKALRRRGVPKGQSLAAFIERYLTEPEVAKKKSAKEKRRILEKDLLGVLGDQKITDITGADIERAIAEKGATVAGNRLLSHSRTFFRWLVKSKFLKTDPTLGIEKPLGKENKRERYLSQKEIPVFWKACDDVPSPYGVLFRFALLTGARRQECASLEWSELDKEEKVWMLPARKAKNNSAHVIPLSSSAWEIIEAQPIVEKSPYVFARADGGAVNAWSAATTALNEACGFERMEDENAPGSWISPHDFRRTTSTGLARLRVKPHIRDRVLCHAKTALDQTYDQWDYVDEKREALEAWSSRVRELVAGQANG
ncbi:tyrosine-type recombinase/integrase [Hyphococcus sp.]|uniref:tyrosine-type recombinase/integrase n=1 Tax=Hyphococcus sp. TaxID=2038636 RepID=UPI0020810DA1|nr:MAG: integrase [Marinicaulis sp.]